MKQGKGKGWYNQSNRHSLARRGIKTVQKLPINTNILPLQVGVIVPSTKKDKPISRQDFNKRIDTEKEWFSKQFGGDTSVESIGSYWSDEKKKLIKEPGAIVWSSMTREKYDKNVKKLVKRLEEQKDEWEQETILFKIEGHDFIYPKQSFIDSEDTKEIPVT